MRSIVYVLALATSIAAPLSAVAATPNTFTSPMSVRHQSQPTEVIVTFRNITSQDRELVVGDQSFKIDWNKTMSLRLPVGAVVKVYSRTNSKVNGQELMQVAESDSNSTVVLK